MKYKEHVKQARSRYSNRTVTKSIKKACTKMSKQHLGFEPGTRNLHTYAPNLHCRQFTAPEYINLLMETLCALY